MNQRQRLIAAATPTITIPGKPDLDALRALADLRPAPTTQTRDPQEYARQHRLLAKERGPARQHRCHFCNAPRADHWALLPSQPDERADMTTGKPRYWAPRLDAYVAACSMCHWHLDALERKLRAKVEQPSTSAAASVPASEDDSGPGSPPARHQRPASSTPAQDGGPPHEQQPAQDQQAEEAMTTDEPQYEDDGARLVDDVPWCVVPGCGRPINARLRCGPHDYRRRHGLPDDHPIREHRRPRRPRPKVVDTDALQGRPMPSITTIELP